MNEVYLSLGGNIGNRRAMMEQAILRVSHLAERLTKKSSLYETEAWGVSGQQPYLNCCVCIETGLNAFELIKRLLEIEKELGRTRNFSATYEPRTIDLDILLFNQDVIEGDLTVPHPRMHLRKFVLIPLSEIAADHLHPVLNKSIFKLLAECTDTSNVTLYQ